jgi:hypothetical protein
MCLDCGVQLSDKRIIRCLKCFHKWEKGKHFAPLHTLFKKGVSSWNKGKKLSKSHRKKLSIKASQRLVGSGNPAWIDGRWSDKRYIIWYNMQRSLRIRAVGTHTYEEWNALKKKFGNMCLCCKKSEPEIKLSQDHIIPISKGGTNFIDNIQPLCLSCNCRKFVSDTNYIKLFTGQLFVNSSVRE